MSAVTGFLGSLHWSQIPCSAVCTPYKAPCIERGRFDRICVRALAARAQGGPKVERPSLREDGGFTISHSVRRFIEAMAGPISS